MQKKRTVAGHFQGLDGQHNDQGLHEQQGQPDEVVNAVEVFKEFHTSKKENKGLSDAAREAVESMERMQAAHVPEGQEPMSSADVVCKVIGLSQGKSESEVSGSTLFLRNAGILTSSARKEIGKERALRQWLFEEQQSSAALVDQLEELKRITEKNAMEIAGFQKMQAASDMNFREELRRIQSSSNSTSPPVALLAGPSDG